MAEERLIDDDKDRKYKIRINEDGEEELVIIDGEEDEEPAPVFEVEEEEIPLTPEQTAEIEKLKEQEELARSEKLERHIAAANKKLGEEDFEGALYELSEAQELDPENGTVYCLKLKTLTRNFTDFLSLEKSAEAAEGVKKYADAEQKSELKSLAGNLGAKIAKTSEEVERLAAENEAKKQERSTVFAAECKRSLILLLCTALPFCALLIAAIVFSTMMFSAENGVYLIVTIVLAALALIAFVATVIAAKGYWRAHSNVVLNGRDTSTKLGREYLRLKAEAELMQKINSCFENDIS